MPTADKLDWPQGEPLFEVSWRAISEALAGNGILDADDFLVESTSNVREIQVAAGSVFYDGDEATGTGVTETLSVGDTDHDRWDIVAFDTATETVVVREGTPDVNPEPPDVTADEVLLAVVYVPAEFDSEFPSEFVQNWRTTHQPSGNTHYPDATGAFDVHTVEAALDALEEAVQVTDYPLQLDDLDAPFPLPLITDLDLDGNDLADDTTTVWDASAGEVPQVVLGGPAANLSTYPLALADLDAPFALPSISDLDLDGNDLTDDTTTVWDAGETHVPRTAQELGQLLAVVDANFTVTTEEFVFVETAAGDTTITLASSALGSSERTRVVQVIDVDGAADANPITVDTESNATIDGESTYIIEDEHSGIALASDDTDWYTAGGGTGVGSIDYRTVFSGTEGGSVDDTEQGIVIVDSIQPNETVEIYKASLVAPDITPVATDVNLELVTFDNQGGYSVQESLIVGDGATVFDSERGDPLASYENNTGSETSIGVIVDNATGDPVEIFARVEGEIQE